MSNKEALECIIILVNNNVITIFMLTICTWLLLRRVARYLRRLRPAGLPGNNQFHVNFVYVII